MSYTIEVNHRVTFNHLKLLQLTTYEAANRFGAGTVTLYRHLLKGPEGLLIYTGSKLAMQFDKFYNVRATVKRYERLYGTQYVRLKRPKIIRELSHFDLDREPALI